MNDKEFNKWLKERWRPFNEWKGRVNERIERLEVRTKLTLAKSAYLKAQAEMRAWQGAAAGRQGEVATSAVSDASEASDKRGKRKRAPAAMNE
ncbi:MAG: hypothetical protein ABW200_08345 [Hyphomicrobiaceae bacterium]